jgi:4-amino-4-deoxy-L-arabinose transferase-like glycosyltransferase
VGRSASKIAGDRAEGSQPVGSELQAAGRSPLLRRLKGTATPIRVIVVLQLAALLAFGLVTVFTFEIWAPIDEHAHFDYVATIADHQRLPTLQADEELGRSFGVHTYEAFQPPLYYTVAAPLLKLSHHHHTRVVILRAFDLVLVLLSVYALWRLVALAFSTWRLAAFSFGLVFFLVPAVVVRSITVSYQPLALLLALAFLTLLLKAWRTPGRQGLPWMIAAGVVLGLAMLTSLLLGYLAVLYLVALARRLWAERTGRMLVSVLACAALPLVILSPWLAFNEHQYGRITPNEIAQKMQEPLINPTHRDYTLGDVPSISRQFRGSYFLPDEWGRYYGEVRGLPEVRDALVAAFLFVPLVILVAARRSFSQEHLLFLGLPLLLNLAYVEGATVWSNWPVTSGRYLHLAGPTWMLFAFVAFAAVRRRALVTAMALFGTLGAVVLWVEILPRYL